MVLTSIADTRLLILLQFPANSEMGRKARDLFVKEARGQLLAPSIILVEFIRVAGARIGEEAVKNRLRVLEERGMQTVPLDKENALTAGSLLLSHRDIPTADAIIASYVKTGVAEYVITDDPHFKKLGVKTRWL
jgi:predicted nucleic acid-binding protein